MRYSEFRIAIVGCGTIAPTHMDAIASLSAIGVRVVACSDSVMERSRAFADKYDIATLTWDELLAAQEVDAVSICTPSGVHGLLGAACLRAGKHVIIEKPLDISLAACDDLIAAQQASGKTLTCICQHRYDPATMAARTALGRGDLGEIILAEARVTWYRTQDYYDSGNWRGTWALDGGGCLMNQGVHTVDLLLWLCGRVTSVYAQCRTAGHERIEVEDAVTATVAFANGAIGTIIASTAAYPGFPVRLAVHGTRGSAVLEGDAMQTLAVIGQETMTCDMPAEYALEIATGGTRSVGKPKHTPRSVQPRDAAVGAAVPPAWGDSHAAQIREFVHCCRTGDPPIVDGPQGRAAVELVLAVYKSAATGRVITLPLTES
jgi:UDP-N-acetyl-2-amino-2-deoxyglucuronate dehydrogenase